MFVVDVSSFTKRGFIGTTRFGGKQVTLDFDDGEAGVFLSSEMASRLHVRRGSRVSLITENERNHVTESVVSGVGKGPRISDEKVYFEVGRLGGAVVRIRRLQ